MILRKKSNQTFKKPELQNDVLDELFSSYALEWEKHSIRSTAVDQVLGWSDLNPFYSISGENA